MKQKVEEALRYQKRCAKVNQQEIRKLWRAAQEAEKEFWLRFTPKKLEGPKEDWKAFGEFLYNTTRNMTEINSDTPILQVGTAVLDGIYFFPIGKRYSVDPLTDWFHERIAWAYDDTVFEVTSVNAPGEDLPFEDGMFTLVVLNNVLDHAFNPAAIISEANRVLHPDDGMLFVGVNVFPEEKCHDLRNNVARHDPCHPYVFSESDVLTLLSLCKVHPVFKKLHDPTNPEEPDERYFAVFGLVRAPETPLPPPPGGGWEPLGTGPQKGLQGRKGETSN